jgi:hypothetical protein
MKKFLLAILALLALAGSPASAQWLTYSYKASIKRMDTKITSVKYSADMYEQTANVTNDMDSYTTATDALDGYLVLPACLGCSESGSETSLPMGQAFLYVVRKADKSKGVWKFQPVISSAAFDKGIGVRPEGDDLEFKPTSMKNLRQAWMDMEFVFDDLGLTATYGKYTIPYGFLGYTSSSGAIDAVGFGAVKLVTQTVSAGLGLCDPQEVVSCLMITSITDGRMIGHVAQIGCCGTTPIWDICSIEQTPDAVVQGTWSIRLNEKLTSMVNSKATYQEAEDALVDKLGSGLVVSSAE